MLLVDQFDEWVECDFQTLLDYEQPTNYIVSNTNYSDNHKIPVLTAGKSFIKGYTDDEEGIFAKLPAIIFDDFTTATQYVNFRFKVKSSAMKILIPTSPLVNMRFVFYAMQVNRMRSDTHKRYWISIYSKRKLKIPSLPEQRAIVARIEELFSSLDQGVADLKKAQEQLKVYRQAVLKKAFEGELTKEWREQQMDLPAADELLEQIKEERQKHYEEQLENWKQEVKVWEESGKEGEKPGKPKFIKELEDFTDEDLSELHELDSYWAWVKVDILCKHDQNAMKAGPFGSSLKKSFFTQSGYKIYGQEQVISGDYKFGNYYVNEEKYQSLINCSVKPYDVLISLVGTVGKVLILPKDCEEGLINPRLVKFSLNEFYSEQFFKYYFESGFVKGIYKLKNHGTTMDVLNLGIIKELPFPLCSKKEQHQIVQEIESRLSVCDKVEQGINESLEKAEALRQSVLKKAFKGSLLSDEEIAACKAAPDYEPASVLLDRIKNKI